MELNIRIYWSDVGHCFVAVGTKKHMTGISAHGDTIPEAIHEFSVAFEGVLEILKEDGESLEEFLE